MSRKLARLGTSALVALLFAGLMAGTAWAPKNLFTNVFSSTCTLSTDDPGRVTSGSFTLESFAVGHDGALMANGQLISLCDGAALDEEFNEAITAPVSVLQEDCTVFDFNLSGVVTNPKETSIDVSPVRILVADMGYPKGMFCAIAALDAAGNTPALVRFLNTKL
ncbi:MAG: hypothetical protein QOH26_1028 [Actinomycetota bacterium]|nr:hypothetical protein [Actinomycetota bacterium]